MVFNLDGKAQKISGRFDDSFSAYKSRRVEQLRDSSPSYGLQQGGYAEDDCPRQDPSGTNTLKRNSSTGKILKRLKLIELKYSDYVDNHQKQLEAQLSESKTHKLELTQEIEELEQEIYNLVSESPNEEESE